jgi:hypothetical protein
LIHRGLARIARQIAAHYACEIVVDFLMHRDEDWLLHDIMMALDQLMAAADHEPPKAAPQRES